MEKTRMKITTLSLILVLFVGSHFAAYRYYTNQLDEVGSKLSLSEHKSQTLFRQNKHNSQQASSMAIALGNSVTSSQQLRVLATEIAEENVRLRAQVDELKKPHITMSKGDVVVRAPQTIDKFKQPIAQLDSPDHVQKVVKTHAENYYKGLRKDGLVFNFDASCDSPREMSGWGNRVEVTGVAHYSYYTNVWGGNFSTETARFTAQVENGNVVDFQNR